MSTPTRTPRGTRWAAVAALTALSATALALPASAAAAPAASAPGTASTTAHTSVDPDALDRLCQDRLPAAKARAAHLLEVIQGGPDVAGSVEWLRARSDQAEQNGHGDRARLLDQRAERRAAHVADITRVVERLEDAATTYCTDAA